MYLSVVQEKMNAVDALYKVEVNLVPRLNDHLAGAPFGPYDHVSEAVNELLHLKKQSHKKKKAEELESLLSSFAVASNSSLAALLQWPALMQLKREGDACSHPFDEAYLRAELERGNASLAPVAGALGLA